MATIPFPVPTTVTAPTTRPVRRIGVWAHPDDERHQRAPIHARYDYLWSDGWIELTRDLAPAA